MLRTLSICSLMFFILSGSALAQSKNVKMKYPVRVLWVLEETIDDVKQKTNRAPDLWKNNFAKINFNFLPEGIGDGNFGACTPEDMFEDDLCPEITGREADIVIGGRITATTKTTGAASANKGVKAALNLNVFRTDNEKKLFDIKLKSYSTAASAPEAYKKALMKIIRPITIKVSNLTNVKFRSSLEAKIKVTGFANRDQKEDILTGLRFVPEIQNLNLHDAKDDWATYSITYANASWHYMVKLINKRQGSGMEARVTGNRKAEASFSQARAFCLLVGVTEVADRTNGLISPEKREKTAQAIEKHVERGDYTLPVSFPVRLPGKSRKAVREMKEQYGGDLVLVSNISRKKGNVFLTIEVWSTFAGRFFVVKRRVVAGEIELAAEKAVADVFEKLSGALKKQGRRLPKFKRSMYEAWSKKKTGG